MEVITFVILSIILIFFFHGIDLYRRRKLPPGPAGLPIIGNLLDLDQSRPHESLTKLAHKHGPLMTIRLGSMTTVVASTPDAARQILQRHDDVCSGRVVHDAVTALKHPDAAILWLPQNDTWRTMRRALGTYLTNQKKLEILIDLRQHVVDGMLGFLHDSHRKKKAVDVGKLALAVALNQMSNTFLSQNVIAAYDCDDVSKFMMSMEMTSKVHGKINIADIFPVLKPFDPQNVRRKVRAAYHWLDEVIENFVSERLKHRKLNEAMFGDMLDSLLDYSRDSDGKFNLIHIKTLLVDLFIAGTDTVATTITWTMTELLLNPDMLSRVRKEVNQVVGEDGKVKEAKILDLPYLNAVIKESMRLHLVVPLLAPHKTEREVKIGDYIVPENTQILVNVWAISRDPKYWEKPTVFMPERFLINKVDFRGQHFEFLPFGSGRRMCAGMPLAHRMVSFIVASFVYHFNWELPHGIEEMDMNDVFGIALLKETPLLATPIPLK